MIIFASNQGAAVGTAPGLLQPWMPAPVYFGTCLRPVTSDAAATSICSYWR